MPNLSRAWGEPSLLPFGCKLVCLQLGQIRGASTAIHHHLLHSHPLRSRPDQIQTPNGPFGFWSLEFGFWILEFGVWSLDFGFWILDLGFWILEFGFWILDQFSLRSFCGGPKRRRLDFGFWILDFGLDEASTDIVWILHKIFPCHADSGRRIRYLSFVRDQGRSKLLRILAWDVAAVPILATTLRIMENTRPKSSSLMVVVGY